MEPTGLLLHFLQLHVLHVLVKVGRSLGSGSITNSSKIIKIGKFWEYMGIPSEIFQKMAMENHPCIKHPI
jgi:hypothetical protein